MTSTARTSTASSGRPPALVRRAALAAGVAAGALGAASAAGSIGAGAYFARVLLTPERHRPEDEWIVAVDDDSVTLRLGEDTRTPGRYGLWFDAGRGHARLGDILEIDEEARTVRRRLDSVDTGELAPGAARWDGYYYPDRPDLSMGLPMRIASVDSEVGDLDTWIVPGDPDGPEAGRGRWAILVHGRGATREECLRAVPTLHRLGITSVVPTYRNDPQGPPSPDGLYNLGLSEWRDTEAAMRFALAEGARDLVLFGWSMGGAIVLQTLDLSPLSAHVSRVVLDSPVIDWVDVIDHHARLRRVPRSLALLSQALIGARWARRLVGVHEPLDVARTNWQDRAGDISHRMLVIHSVDDEFVPVGPSRELARRRPDLVEFAEWHTARHVKEWNTDPERWERIVAEFLTA